MSVNTNGINYELDSLSQTASVAGNFDSDSGVIAIPSSILYGGISYNVTSIGEDAFFCCTGLTSITILDRVTSIGKSAFNDCIQLSIIRIPKGQKSIFCEEDRQALQDKFIEYTETLIGNWVKDR